MALGFKIADGYVEVHARADRDSAVAAARSVVKDVDKEGRKEAEKNNKNGGFLKALFTPNPEILEILTRPIGKIFSVPVVLAAGASFAVALAGLISTAIVTGILTGLGAGFIGLGIFVLRKNKDIKHGWEKLTTYMEKRLTKLAEPLIKPILRGFNLIKILFDRAAPSFGRIFEGVAPMIQPLITAFSGLLTGMLPGIERALPGIQVVVEALAEHLPGLGTAIGDFFATIAENHELLETVVGLMITWLDNFFKVLGPILVFLMQAFAGWGLAWSAMTEKIKQFIDWAKIPFDWKGFFGAIGEGIMTALGWIRDQWNSFAGWIGGIWDAIWGAAVRAWNAIHIAIGIAIRAALAVVAAILGNIQSVWNAGWNTIHSVIAMIWQRIGNTIRAAIAFGLSIIRGFISGASSAINTLGSIPARVGGFFLAMFNRANTYIQQLLAVMRSIPNGAVRALGNLGSVLYNAGRNLIQGLINGVRNAIGELRGLLNSVTGWIPDWKGPMEKDRRLLEPTGDAIMSGLMRGIRRNLGGLRGLLGSVTTGIPTMAMAGVPSGASASAAAASPAATTNSYGGNNVTVQVNGIQELKEFMDFMNGKSRTSAKSDRWASTIYNENAGYERGYK